MLYPNGSRTRPAVSSPFGPRRGGAFSIHYGADLVGYSIVRAAGAGKVTFAGWMNSAAGNTIIIDLGGGVSEVHMHLASFSVKRGDRLNEGDGLGRMGSTGNASGNCDHFEIRVNGTSVDPLAYTAARISPDNNHGEEPEMPLNAVTDYDAFKTMLQRALRYDVRPDGAGADWKFGPTLWERLDQVQAGVKIDAADAATIAAAIPDGIAAQVVDALAKRLKE